MIPRLFRPILDWEKRGRFSFSLVGGDAALGAWLLFAQRAFLGLPLPSSHTLGKFAVGIALISWVVQLHAFTGRKLRWLFAKAALSVPLIVFLATRLHSETREALWLGIALATLLAVYRVGFFAARARWPEQPLEVFRWGLLLGAATALLLPFYRAVSVGSGDAYWYTIMLADFTTQLRAGIFPVWVGQSEFAFNGAVSPLRLAPWFQHVGGLLDLLTVHALHPVALKNATIALNGIATIFSAYGCLRVVLARRPGIASILAALWLASPGVLAPLIMGDLIMTFMAMPFLPLVLLGSYQVWTRDSSAARLLLATGLAGMWLAHTPVAIWATLLAVTICAVKFLLNRKWKEDTRRAVFTSAVFLLLGSFPVLSLLAIDNQNSAKADGSVAAEEVARCFPANFLPINAAPGADPLFTIQVGYAALGGLGLALLLLLWIRPPGGIIFGLVTVSVALFVLPVPWANHAFWSHAPPRFVAINNIWPMQRLFALWALLMFFTLAVVIGDERISRRTWLTTLCLILLGGTGVWSWQEARKLGRHVDATATTPSVVANTFAPRNLVLTRYAYASFSAVPAYVSHAYMHPLLENRLLDRATLKELVANADRAAPPVRLPVSPGAMPRLVQAGVLTAVNRQGDEYGLEPTLPLAPGVNHALRLEFLRPGPPSLVPGLVQGFSHGIVRQYMLPDSGAGLSHAGPSRAFGSLPESGHVMPLQSDVDQPVEFGLTFVGSGSVDDKSAPSERFAFARYWLYTYTAADLAITVDSWLPYRAHTEAAEAAWLETPRMWLRGYQATVNGTKAEVRRSPQNLVMIALERGRSTVTLQYVAPLWLSFAFWLSFSGWVGFLVLVVRRVTAQARAVWA